VFCASRDSELENGILYPTNEEQWKSNSDLKVDHLVTPFFEKVALKCFGTPTGELFFVYTHSPLFISS
jgi:glutaredoxin 2